MASSVVNGAHADGQNQQFSTIGVIGTLGTADTQGTARTLPFAVDPLTGAAYVNNIGTSSTVNVASGTFNAGTVTILNGTMQLSGTPNVNVISGTFNAGTINNGSIVVTAGTIGTVSNVGSITNIGTIKEAGTVTGVGTNSGVGVVTTVSNLTNGSVKVTAGSFVGTINSGTIDSVTTVSNLTNGSIKVTAGTEIITSGSIAVTAGTITSGSIVVTTGTVTSGSIVVTAGTIGDTTVKIGTINSGTFNVGTINTGTINTGTFRDDGRPSRNILSFGSTFTFSGSNFATIVGSASIGAGTSLWVNDISIISTGTVSAGVMFGSNINGTAVLAKGYLLPGGGIEKPFPKTVNAGMTNTDLNCWVDGAGTINVVVSYFIST